MEMSLLDMFKFSTESQHKVAIKYYHVDEKNNQVIKDNFVTYGELETMSSEFSRCISSISENEKAVIGIMLHPCIELIISIIGVLKAECVFVPLELNPSSEFLKRLLRFSGMRFMVTDSQNTSQLENSFELIDQKFAKFDEKCFKNFYLYEIESERHPFPLDQIAYIMHTSGTTGEPKWIAVPHNCIVPNIVHLSQLFQVDSSSKIAMMSPPTFDPSIVEMFLAFANNASLIVPSTAIKMNPTLLVEVLFEDAKVSILQATPALMKRFSLHYLRNRIFCIGSSLKTMIFGGECCPDCQTIKNWIHHDVFSDKLLQWNFFNIYGITEVSSWASCYKIPIQKILDGNNDPIPLGNPLWKTEFQVRDQINNDILCTTSCHNIELSTGRNKFNINSTLFSKGDKEPKKFDGKLYIGGPARFCHILGERDEVFRDSGDIVNVTVEHDRILSIFFIGRNDSMVKRNGKRFSLSFVTNNIFEISDIETCHVLRVKEKIVAFVVRQHTSAKKLSSGKTIALTNLKSTLWTFQCFQMLSKKLESLYLPDNILEINLLPVTPHGKVNECELKDIFTRMTMTKKQDINEENVRKVLCTILPSCLPYLGTELDSLQDNFDNNFLQLGGDSLKAAMLINWLDVFLSVSITQTLPDVMDILYNQSINNFIKIFLQKYRNIEKFDCNEESPFKKKRLHTDENIGPDLFLKSCRRRCDLLCISRGSKVYGFYHNELDRKCESETFRSIILEDKWKYNTGKCLDASPLIAFHDSKGTCFIGSHSHLFSAISLESGCKIWEVNLPDRIESSACLSCFDDMEIIIVGCYDGTMYSFLANTGKIWWKYETGSQVKSSPCWAVGTSLVYIGSHDGYLNALDIQKRECLWKVHCGGGAVFSSPTFYFNQNHLLVFVATLGGNLLSMSGYSGDIIWSYNVGKPMFSSPCINDSAVCIGCVDCSVYFFNIHNGEKLWSFKTDEPIFSSPTFSKDRNCVFIGSHDGYLYCIRNNNGSLAWRSRISTNDKSAIYSTPFVVSTKKSREFVVFASTSGDVCIADQKSGNILATKKLPGEVFSSPVVVIDSDVSYDEKVELLNIVIGCRDDNVYCLRLRILS